MTERNEANRTTFYPAVTDQSIQPNSGTRDATAGLSNSNSNYNTTGEGLNRGTNNTGTFGQGNSFDPKYDTTGDGLHRGTNTGTFSQGGSLNPSHNATGEGLHKGTNATGAYGTGGFSDSNYNTTGDGLHRDANTTGAYGQEGTFNPNHHNTTATNTRNNMVSNPDAITSADTTSGERRTGAGLAGPVNASSTQSPLNPHHRPSIDNASEGQGIPGDTTIRRASLAQNAPGTAGEIGENALGALGYGGSRVERPVQDQGLGEKVMDFLGA